MEKGDLEHGQQMINYVLLLGSDLTNASVNCSSMQGFVAVKCLPNRPEQPYIWVLFGRTLYSHA